MKTPAFAPRAAIPAMLAAFAVLVVTSHPAFAQDTAPSIVETFDPVAAFLAAPATAERAIRVDSLALDVGRGRVRLGPGTLVALAVPGRDPARPFAAVFAGEARIDYAARRAVEREEMRRLVGRDAVSHFVGGVLVVSCDGALADAFAAGSATTVDAAARKRIDDLLRGFARTFDKHDGDGWASLLHALLHGGAGGYRLAVGFEAGEAAVGIQLDPTERESSSYVLRDKKVDNEVVLVSQEEAGDEATGASRIAGDLRPSLVAEQVTVDATIGDDLEARMATTVAARAHVPGPAWVRFWLTSDAKLDSVTVDGAPAPWGRIPDASAIWVRLPAGIDRGMATDLRFVTRGKIFDRYGDWIALKSSILWLPTHDTRQRVPYDLRFRSPKAYRLVAVGNLVETSTDGRQTVSRWTVARPQRNPTFAIGPFDEAKLDDPRLPAVTVLHSKSMQREVRASYEGGEVGGDLSKQAIADLTNSMKFYRTMFGDPPDTTIVAAEIPYTHGEAFPGLANLSWQTFSDVTDETWPMHMRAHEMAHQWWPIGVEFATYRDRWLSEGMADFCALWFAQVSKGDPRDYFERLDEWKGDLLPLRWKTAGNPEEASPISLGHRVRNKPAAASVYSYVVYSKGAWVLHMLRAMMLDPRTLRDDRFAEFLRETYRTYRGRTITTADLRAMAEKQVGEDLGWFFTQWVDGTAIPTYRWAWRKEQSGGKWKVEVRVAASETPDDFRMPVPVRIDLGEGRSVRFRVEVAGKEGTSSVEGLDAEPKDVEFNEFAGVLCEVKKEAW